MKQKASSSTLTMEQGQLDALVREVSVSEGGGVIVLLSWAWL